jgi:hypothetical protein
MPEMSVAGSGFVALLYRAPNGREVPIDRGKAGLSGRIDEVVVGTIRTNFRHV